MREITSAPNGCCAFSIELTAAGWPVSRSSSVATTVVVPRSKAIACRLALVSPASTSIRTSSQSTAVTFQSACAKRPAERAQQVDRHAQLDVVHRFEHALEVGGLILERRLAQLEVALLHRRPQDHVPADADERRLGPRLQLRHRDDQILLGGRATGEPPARLQLLDRERSRVDRRQRLLARRDAHLALLARAVAAARRVDRDAVPAGAVEERRPRGNAHLLHLAVGLLEDDPDALDGGSELDADGVGAHAVAAASAASCFAANPAR